MTATDELLTLLKEHGVEHYEHEAPATGCIAFFDGEGWHDCWESVDGEVNVTFSMTPEQAIAATLGSSNCTNSERTGACHIDLVGYNQREDRFQCRSCDWSMWFKRGTWPRFNYCPNCGAKVVD